jgi:hypothetical protein
VPKVNKLSPPSKIKNFNNSNSSNNDSNSFKDKKYGESNKKADNIFMNHINKINLEENKKKINLAIKRTSPASFRNNNSSVNNNKISNKKNNLINKNIGDLIVENNNIKLKISKKAINNCLNDFKTNISDYSDNSLNNNKNTKNKNKSFIYNRKRNCSFGYNIIYNSSNNQSKDSNKKSLNKTIQSVQSLERDKIIYKQNNSYNKNNANNYCNSVISKCNDNKKNALNNQNKKLTIIQNFSRYKKKSTIINLNSETNEYFVNDENYNGENKNKDKQIKDSNYIKHFEIFS